MKRFSIVLLTIAVLCTTAFVSDYSIKEEKSLKAYNDLLQSFRESEVMLADNVEMQEDRYDYPENYAGAYINDDGKLVIKVSDNALSTGTGNMKNIQGKVNKDDVEYEYAEHSYNELLEVYNIVSDYMVNEDMQDEVKKNISVVRINEVENRVDVTLNDVTEESVVLFRERVCSSSLIHFQKVKEEAKTEATKDLDLGSCIVSGVGRQGSIGFRCKAKDANGNYTIKGFVTAGHMTKAGESIMIPGTIIYDNYTTIGKTTKSINANGGKVDAAFVQITNSNYEATLKT